MCILAGIFPWISDLHCGMELKPQQPLFAALGISTAQATLARFLLPEPLLILYNLSSSKKVHLNSLQTVKLQDLCHCLHSQRDYSKHHWIKTCNAEAEKQLPGFSWSNCLRFMALQSEAQLGTAAIVGLDLARFGGHGNFHSLHSRGGMLYGWQYWSEAFSSPRGQSKNQFKRSFWVWITVWYVLIEWSVDIQSPLCRSENTCPENIPR